jgi:hypothetical protein
MLIIHLFTTAAATAAAADDQLLGSLTEQDPARFYKLMDHLVRHVQPANLQVLLPMSASFLTRSLMKDDLQQQQQLEQQQVISDSSETSTASPADAAAADSSSSSASEAVTAAEIDAALNGGSQLSGKYAVRTKKSMVILSDYAVCRSFAAALHGYSKSVVGPVLSQQPPQQQQQELDAAANSSSSSSQQPQWFIDNDTPVHYVLPPLQKVAEWLAVGLEDAIITALQGQEGASVTSAAAAAAEAASDNDSSSDRPNSPKKAAKQQEQQEWTPQVVAAQVKSASQAAACSLVLITLLARAAVPVLQELQLSLQELPTATSAGSGNSSSSSNPSPAAAADADALVTEAGAVDLLSGLMFVRAAYQALCARCYLTQVLNGLPAKLNGARSVAGATAEDVAALQAVKGALKGEGLARGWAHLVQPVPPGVVVRVRGFQDRHPGDFVANTNLLQQLLPVGVVEASSSSGAGKEAAAAVPQMMLHMKGEMRQQLDVLLTDLLGLFGSLLGEVPLPVGCNNPACTNLEGVAEASLSVNKRCKSCLAAHYCSKQCQTEHWAAHKGACLRIRSLSQK